MAKRGRPEYKPDDETRAKVSSLAIGGATQEQICEILEIDRKTLAKYYKQELAGAKLQQNGDVIGMAYKMATSGEHPALTIFWLKTQCGWREKDPVINPDSKAKRQLVFNRGDTRPSQQEPEVKKTGTGE